MKKSLTYRVQEFLADRTKSVQYPRDGIRTIKAKREPMGSLPQAMALIVIGIFSGVISLILLCLSLWALYVIIFG